jgi:hypothetical protein
VIVIAEDLHHVVYDLSSSFVFFVTVISNIRLEERDSADDIGSMDCYLLHLSLDVVAWQYDHHRSFEVVREEREILR